MQYASLVYVFRRSDERRREHEHRSNVYGDRTSHGSDVLRLERADWLQHARVVYKERRRRAAKKCLECVALEPLCKCGRIGKVELDLGQRIRKALCKTEIRVSCDAEHPHIIRQQVRRDSRAKTSRVTCDDRRF